MTIILQSIGALSIIVGVIFSALGVVGILRLPDTYTRLHASGKTSTLGILFICLGTVFIIPEAALKLIALAIFIIFSGPVGSHAIAAAVHRGAVAYRAIQELETAEMETIAEEEDTKEPIAVAVPEEMPEPARV